MKTGMTCLQFSKSLNHSPFRTILFLSIVALNLHVGLCGCADGRYEINGECCPVCQPGHHVYWHCTADTSTTCIPCPKSTYTDQPNGLDECFPCSVCDTGKRLKLRRICKRYSNTQCDAEDGFYCTKQHRGCCESAVEHSECKPGEYIKNNGTSVSDTVCENCTAGTFSNGSLMSCKPHLKCEAAGLTAIKAGTTSSDAECGASSSLALIIGVIVGVLAAAAAAACFVLAVFFFKKHKALEKTVLLDFDSMESHGQLVSRESEKLTDTGRQSSSSPTTMMDSNGDACYTHHSDCWI